MKVNPLIGNDIAVDLSAIDDIRDMDIRFHHPFLTNNEISFR